MPRPSKPWKRKQDGCWYAKIDGKQVKLADAGEPHEVALRRFYEEKRKRNGSDPAGVGLLTVSQLIDDYLEWCKEHRSERTYEWYRDYLVNFHAYHGTGLLADKLRPHHVQKWLIADYRGKSNNHKRGAVRAIQRVMNWAVKSGYMPSNPIRNMEKPPQEARETYITQEQFQQMLDACTDQQIRDYLVFMWETGCRTQEIRLIEAKHFRDGVITLERVNSKGKKYQRVIYLNDVALAIVTRLAAEWPDGPIFRNSDGAPWKRYCIRGRFRRFKRILGIPELCSTVLRHSWATDVLTAGMDTTTASILMGHRDPATLARNYQHLTQNREYLKEAAKRARSNGESQSS